MWQNKKTEPRQQRQRKVPGRKQEKTRVGNKGSYAYGTPKKKGEGANPIPQVKRCTAIISPAACKS